MRDTRKGGTMAVGMLHWRDNIQKVYRTAGLQDRWDEGLEGCRKGGKEECRKGSTQESMNAEKEVFRTVWMQDMKHA